MKEIAIFLAEGFEEIEGLTVVDLLRRAGISITMVSISGEIMVTGAHGICVKADIIFEKVDFDGIDMIVLPGGMPGTKNLMAHKNLVSQVIEFHIKNKRIAAICAAPRLLGENGILEGKTAVCYPGNEEYLEGATIGYEDVAVDGNIITSRGLGTAIEFSSAIIAYYCGEDKAAEIKKSILFHESMTF